ncbi:hypothetical protein L208DRAFT_1451169 [Tricholoma matsutake]|nr:hypothetical protein L208DRAFT_1451169 [Tricholoma matsutake 945]
MVAMKAVALFVVVVSQRFKLDSRLSQHQISDPGLVTSSVSLIGTVGRCSVRKSSDNSQNVLYDKSSISDLVAHYGSSSATAWLEFSRYKIWRPSRPIAESDFLPVQGYMRKDPYIFAWGNPLVSHRVALGPTATAFMEWAESQGLRLIWCCVDQDLEHVLAEYPFQWSVVTCIYEDVVNPAHVVHLTSAEAVGKQGGASVVKDLKKNLKRAERGDVEVREVRNDWEDKDKRAVEEGIQDWIKSRTGMQIASTTVQPWLDFSHRRYWLAQSHGKAVGIIILTPIHGNTWQIKNAISFPSAPRGTSEMLIYTVLKDLYHEEEQEIRYHNQEQLTVTFGISAAGEMEPVENLSGWKVTALAKFYSKIAYMTGLGRRGEFRRKFDSKHKPMYVCYPANGFGLDGVNAMLTLLKK